MAIELAQVIHCQSNLLFLSIFRFRSEIGIDKSKFFCTTYQSFLLNLSSKDISTKNRCPVKWYVIQVQIVVVQGMLLHTYKGGFQSKISIHSFSLPSSLF